MGMVAARWGQQTIVPRAAWEDTDRDALVDSLKRQVIESAREAGEEPVDYTAEVTVADPLDTPLALATYEDDPELHMDPRTYVVAYASVRI